MFSFFSLIYQAVHSQSQQQERELRERLLKAEAEKQILSSRLENAQRKLDQTQGTNTALNQQVGGETLLYM